MNEPSSHQLFTLTALSDQEKVHLRAMIKTIDDVTHGVLPPTNPLIRPLHSPPPSTGRWATSQSALLCGLFNNVERKGDKNQSEGGNDFAAGAPSVTFTSSRTLSAHAHLCVCVRFMALCQTNDGPPAEAPKSRSATRVTKRRGEIRR